MNTIKIDAKKTKMIAHRGLSALECENTNAAFIAAGNRNYFGIETDVHVTADGTFVIIHDDDTKRVAEVSVNVEGASYEDLQKIHLWDMPSGKKLCRSDLSIPTLEEYIRICKKYEKIAVLELKNHMEADHIAKIVDAIKNEGYLEHTIFISFDCENLIAVKALAPEQTVQYLICEWEDNLIEKLKRHGLDLDIYYPSVTLELVQKLHQNNIKINCWTCDDKETAEKLISWGIDYLTTNGLQAL